MREPELPTPSATPLEDPFGEEWALSAGGHGGRSLRIALAAVPSSSQAVALYLAAHDRIDGPVRCLAAALPFEDGVWPRVVLHHALEHPRVGRVLLSEAIRVLAPGGEFVVFGFDPLAPGVLARWLSDARWRRDRVPIPPYRLAHTLGLIGLAQITIERRGPRFRAWPRSGELALVGGWGRCLYLLRARKLEGRVIPMRRSLGQIELPATGLAPSAGRRALEVV